MSDALKFQNNRPVFAVSTGNMDWNHTGSWRYMRPRYEEKLPPCTDGCPTHEKIPQYFAHVKREDYGTAWEIILEDNPLPGVCGRVCYHPCEGVCNRGEFDAEISINAMERFVADQNLDRSYPDRFHVPSNGKRVAVVGSGPAGLSAAYQLGRRGYGVTIFEAAPEPGGMLRLGIPEYRLPRTILDKEIADIQSLGVA
ncbi:MAG: FAD-dependent oxidoreductase, partial [Fidelibacterota bacterium]